MANVPEVQRDGLRAGARLTLNRARAFMDQALERLKTAKRNGKTFVDVLEDQAMEDPRGFLDWVEVKLGKYDVADEAAGGKLSLNISNLWLDGMQQANAAPQSSAPIVDVTPRGTIGVQPNPTDCNDW